MSSNAWHNTGMCCPACELYASVNIVVSAASSSQEKVQAKTTSSSYHSTVLLCLNAAMLQLSENVFNNLTSCSQTKP